MIRSVREAARRSLSGDEPPEERHADAARVAAGPVLRAAVGAAEPFTAVVVDGVSLAFSDDGSGPAVVCLHAIGHGAGDFTRLRERLRDRYRVVALDWPGQGRSEEDRVPASAQRYAQLLDGFLAAIGLRQAVLVGNSIGGAAAILHARAHPAAVRALVLENPGGLSGTTDRLARTVLAAMVRFFAAGSSRAWWFPAVFAAYYRMVLQRRAAAAQRRRIVASAFEIAPLLQQAWSGFAAPAADLRALAPEIRCPVLFAWATRDQFVQLGRSRATIERFPDARLERFPAGHAAHLETPEAFEIALEHFLKEIEERDRP
jgi:4,5:9,10-diseco-3-hydroxy-5,9,17-trioxoandrosta-1(10),2-diene-4-oate hydrolase